MRMRRPEVSFEKRAAMARADAFAAVSMSRRDGTACRSVVRRSTSRISAAVITLSTGRMIRRELLAGQ
jgi:hypothetical protein